MPKIKWNRELLLRCVKENKLPSEIETEPSEARKAVESLLKEAEGIARTETGTETETGRPQ